MPKDKTKNVDRYKVRGGHLNDFEFHQNQGAFSQQPENGGLPPDKAKAAHTGKLPDEDGETVPEPKVRTRPQECRQKNAQTGNRARNTGKTGKASAAKTATSAAAQARTAGRKSR